jgi:hypothetical protein
MVLLLVVLLVAFVFFADEAALFAVAFGAADLAALFPRTFVGAAAARRFSSMAA